jgi:hypothetical protein
MYCAEHGKKLRRRTRCQRHVSSLRWFIKALDDLNLVKDRALGRQLEWISTSKDYVSVAANYGERSEEERTLARAEGRAADEPGWEGALDFLARFCIPCDYLPDRRDAWIGDRRGVETRRQTRLRAHSQAFTSWNRGRQSHHDALADPRRRYYAALFAARAVSRESDGAWPLKASTPEARELRAAATALTKAEKASAPLWDTALDARKAYATLGAKGRTTLVSGETLVLPRNVLQHYWSAIKTELVALFEERLAEIRRSGRRLRQGYTPLALSRWAIAGVAPRHLDTTIAQMRFWSRS